MHFIPFHGFGGRSRLPPLPPREEAGERRLLSSGGLKVTPNSPLKKPPGEGTGPTIHLDFRGNLVGRVPSRGEPDVFEQAANDLAASCRQIVRSRIVSLCRQDVGSTPNRYGPSLRSLRSLRFKVYEKNLHTTPFSGVFTRKVSGEPSDCPSPLSSAFFSFEPFSTAK